MDAQTKKALQGSINKWAGIVGGDQEAEAMTIDETQVEIATRAFLEIIKPSWASRPLSDLNRVDLDDSDFEILDAMRAALLEVGAASREQDNRLSKAEQEVPMSATAQAIVICCLVFCLGFTLGFFIGHKSGRNTIHLRDHLQAKAGLFIDDYDNNKIYTIVPKVQ